MASATLEKYLDGPRCESCGIGRVRPISLVRGELVLFGCSNRLCHFTTHVELPSIRKKVIYLDTSIVSHMRGQRRVVMMPRPTTGSTSP